MIPETIFAAKGDLLGASANDTPAVLTVGANGETLVADSSTPTGLKYQAPTVNTVIDSVGDLLVGTAADTIGRVPIGTNGQVLTSNGTTTVWSTPSSGMSNPMTTTGDTIYSSSGSTPARLGIGSAGQVLTVAGGVPSWASAPSSSQNWSLLNSGGTALTGSNTVTISGISGKGSIMILVSGASSNTASDTIGVRLNTDATSNYWNFGRQFTAATSYSTGIMSPSSPGSGIGYINFGNMSSNAGSSMGGYVLIHGCNTSGVKMFNAAAGFSAAGGNGAVGYLTGGFYNSSSTISSISIVSIAGNLDAGTVYVYASA
jgi:hypothetical protein